MSIKVGVNLFSVLKEVNEDYLGTLERVVEIGYEYVELLAANFRTGVRFSEAFPLQVVQRKFEELGLKPIAAHEGAAPGKSISELNWDEIIRYNYELGCEAVVLPSAWIQDRESALRTAEELNAIGKRCRENGLQFYFHNHAHELKSVGDTTLLELLLENTDPENLKAELDLVWVMRGGVDPLALLEKLGPRCDIIHQKDLSRDAQPVSIFDALQPGEEDMPIFQAYRKYFKPGDFVDFGEGIVDFAALYAKLKEMGYVRYAIVENESHQEDKIGCIARDLKFIQQYV
ncbi:sugar phosphate isomerase/epimerase family protein [Alicyclobacillus fodiniaquatilis]|uniref:Sugar phosphate isomerase/epimerase family protein n=1 Tax=Alicyclobacillus fodiniaquatilis TaxID=1661150 RepID=A0ABW4JH48_9BACL